MTFVSESAEFNSSAKIVVGLTALVAASSSHCDYFRVWVGSPYFLEYQVLADRKPIVAEATFVYTVLKYVKTPLVTCCPFLDSASLYFGTYQISSYDLSTLQQLSLPTKFQSQFGQ